MEFYSNNVEDIENSPQEIKEFNDTIDGFLGEKEAASYRSNNRYINWVRSKKGRVIFVAVILFLKFASQAQAAGPSKPVSDTKKFNTEVGIEKKLKGGDEKTFNLEPYNPAEASPEQMANIAKLDLSNSYETDKADISDAHAEGIKQMVSDFLSHINPVNFDDLMQHPWEIYASSDERLTNKWSGGNYELSNARVEMGEKIIKQEISEHDFSHSGLTEEQIKTLKNKNFKHIIAESKNGSEKGVTYLTDLKNPTTGENYTESEIEKMKKEDSEKYLKLLESCRYVKVNLMAEEEDIKPVPSKPVVLIPGTPPIIIEKSNIPVFEKYKDIFILMDNSPSMAVAKQEMAKNMIDRYSEGTIVSSAAYSDQVSHYSKAEDMKKGAVSLQKIPNNGGNREKPISCTIEVLKKYNSQKSPDDKRLILVNTDESLHDVSYNKLVEMKELSKTKGVDVVFLLYYHGENGKTGVAELSLDGLVKNFTKDGGAFYSLKKKFEKLAASSKAYVQRYDDINNEEVDVKKIHVDDTEQISFGFSKTDQIKSGGEPLAYSLSVGGKDINLPNY